MKKKLNFYALLVNMKHGTTTLENYTEISY